MPQDPDPVGDVQDPADVGVGRIGAGRRSTAEEEEGEYPDGVREVLDAVALRVASPEGQRVPLSGSSPHSIPCLE